MPGGISVGLEAIFEPSFDEKETDKAVKDLEDALEKAEELEVEADFSGVEKQARSLGLGEDLSFGGGGGDGVGDDAIAAAAGGQLAKGGVGSRLGGVGAAAAGGAGGAMGALKGAGKAALPVALAGGVGIGILKGVQKMASFAPRGRKMVDMFAESMKLFFRPFGDIIGKALMPYAKDALKTMAKFNRIYSDKGLEVALTWIGGKVLDSLVNGIGGAIGEAVGVSDKTGLAIGGIGAGIAAGGILSAVFGGVSMTSGALLSFLFGGLAITAPLILSHIFGDVSVTEAGILQILFGGLILTVGSVLGAVFGGVTITGAAVLGAVFAGLAIGAGKVLSHIFPNINIKEGRLLGVIFAGLAITAAGVLGVIFGGIPMTAALILGVVFGGVVVTGAAIINYVFPQVSGQAIIDRIVPGNQGRNNNRGNNRGPGGPQQNTEPWMGGGNNNNNGGGGGGGNNGSLLGSTGPIIPTGVASLMGFDSGGLVTKPTLGVVGEAGPEAVFPLDDLRNMLGGTSRGDDRVTPRATSNNSRGGGVGATESKQDEIIRAIRELGGDIGEMSVEIDGETLVRKKREANKRYSANRHVTR